MHPIVRFLILGLLAFLSLVRSIAFADDGTFFIEKVQPIFAAKCVACHGPTQQKSGYRLDVREIGIAGAEMGGPAIVPGKSSESSLYRYVSDDRSDIAMPPKGSKQSKLTSMELDIVRQWIDRGAVWPDSASLKLEEPANWWSFQPLRIVTPPTNDENPIDAFVKSKLYAVGLEPSPPADPQTLVRRIYFDLSGLPPTPETIEQFVLASKRDSDKAYKELVDELLASPRYGERWARHWLDVVHYGDTHGYDKDKPRPNAWPYRDYVIRSFNDDKPYSRFIEEQIAGDILYPDSRDGFEALGFLSAGPWDFIGHAEVAETKIDGKIARHLDRDDMVANTMGSFCSVTVHCAQCHNHKFDPIPQEDYYNLQSVFAAIDRTDRKYYTDPAVSNRARELDQAKRTAQNALAAIENPLQKLAGQAFQDLTKKIDEAAKEKGNQPNQHPEYGFHSGIAKTQNTTKWVQIDLGQHTNIASITIRPCHDDFNRIGAGFGFPVRFQIEASDDADFERGVVPFESKRNQTFENDFPNPRLTPFTVESSVSNGFSGRYVRLTATRLAKRSDDYILALSEFEVLDSDGNNVALGKSVTALDSTEAGPRWSKSNLTDGKFPKPIPTESKEKLIEERETLLLRFANESTRRERADHKLELSRLNSELAKLPPPSVVYAGGIHNGTGTFVGTGPENGKPRPIFVLARGQVTSPGKAAIPGALSVLPFQAPQFAIPQEANEGHRRVALAKWISDPENPLTYRSIVNRVWQYHFGRGLVDTPNDFGRNGSPPSHPELLDWLAISFRDQGGSLKALHRMILTSKTYRQSSIDQAHASRVDSDNTLLWRQNRRRLEAEAIRDSVLSVSGKLDLTMGGPGWQDFVVEHPEHSPHYEYALANPEDKTTWRRSIYRFIVRSQTQPWMTSLDCADPSMRVDKRNESLSAIQALALLNNGFILTQSKHFAERVVAERSGLESQVERAYVLSLGCSPDEATRSELVSFAKQHGIPNLCRVLLNLNSFCFVD